MVIKGIEALHGVNIAGVETAKLAVERLEKWSQACNMQNCLEEDF